jgi:hypothetical protein
MNLQRTERVQSQAPDPRMSSLTCSVGPDSRTRGSRSIAPSAGKIFNTSNSSPSSPTSSPTNHHFSTVQHFSPSSLSPWSHNETSTRHRRMATQYTFKMADHSLSTCCWRVLTAPRLMARLLTTTTTTATTPPPTFFPVRIITRKQTRDESDFGTTPLLPLLAQRLQDLPARHLFSSGDEQQAEILVGRGDKMASH